MLQKTLRKECHIQGVGLHSGRQAVITIRPAPVNHGIVFRSNAGGEPCDIPARYGNVTRTMLSTNLGIGCCEVRTVEHLMAALTGLEIDNALIEVDGLEVPIMDGSAAPFAQSLRQCGLKTQHAPRRWLKVLAPVEVSDGEKFAALYPSEKTVYHFKIAFDHQAIQEQSRTLALTPDSFMEQVADSRTFGFEASLQALQKDGLALGAGLQNAVGLGADGSVLNPEGLRHDDEFVRHKILDAVGDLSLCGSPLMAEYHGVRSGHALNLKLLHTLFSNPESYCYVEATHAQAAG